MNKDKLIKKLKQNLGNKYDYSLVTDSLTSNGIKIKLICLIHGVFEKNILAKYLLLFLLIELFLIGKTRLKNL